MKVDEIGTVEMHIDICECPCHNETHPLDLKHKTPCCCPHRHVVPADCPLCSNPDNALGGHP